MNKIKNSLLLIFLSSLLCACAGFFDKDNTPKPSPLVNFQPEAKVQTLWNVRPTVGAGNHYVKLLPALSDNAIYTADKRGTIAATDKNTGKSLWQISARSPITAGPGLSDQFVFVGSKEGELFALTQAKGELVWKIKTASELFATPVARSNIVLIKTIDGKLTAVSAQDGHELWHYQQNEPALILRGGSAPQMINDSVIVGFANGNLAKLTLNEGNLLWQAAIAAPTGSFAVQRMIDIDANPWVSDNRIYAATYQGRIVALDLSTGHELWSHPLSSYTGMVVDETKLYVTDANSMLFAFDKNNGKMDWQQTQLVARNTTAPVIMGPYLVVADGEGYLHWLSKADGHLVARIKVHKSGIIAAPRVDHNRLYVVTRDGHLAAYTLV